MSAKQWLAENDIKEKAYYYWLRKFRKEACNQMQLPTATAKTDITFAEVTMPTVAAGIEPTPPNDPHGSTVAVIKCGRLTIELSNDISEGLLSRLLQEVAHA